ncbi:MAG: hypothetical protein KF872_12145, partial [Chitinophagales bacterium]|nr:hypothetical protein [Chitinophagales bacterium]
MGIGTLTPNASSILELSASDKGFLVPRISATQRLAIASPARGLLVYDTDSSCFFFYDVSWRSLCASSLGAIGITGATGAT